MLIEQKNSLQPIVVTAKHTHHEIRVMAPIKTPMTRCGKHGNTTLQSLYHGYYSIRP